MLSIHRSWFCQKFIFHMFTTEFSPVKFHQMLKKNFIPSFYWMHLYVDRIVYAESQNSIQLLRMNWVTTNNWKYFLVALNISFWVKDPWIFDFGSMKSWLTRRRIFFLYPNLWVREYPRYCELLLSIKVKFDLNSATFSQHILFLSLIKSTLYSDLKKTFFQSSTWFYCALPQSIIFISKFDIQSSVLLLYCCWEPIFCLVWLVFDDVRRQWLLLILKTSIIMFRFSVKELIDWHVLFEFVPTTLFYREIYIRKPTYSQEMCYCKLLISFLVVV